MRKWNLVHKSCDLPSSHVKADVSPHRVGWWATGGALVGDVGERLSGTADLTFICYLFDGLWF